MAGALDALIDRANLDFEALFDALPDGALYTGIDRTVQRVNPALLDMLGLESRDLIGHSAAVMYADPDEYRRNATAWSALNADNRVLRQEVVLRRSGGRTFRAEVVGRLVIDAADCPVGYIGIVRDVEEARRDRDRLVQTGECLEAIVAASPLAITVLEPDGTVALWNVAAERKFGWTSDEVLGRPVPNVPDRRRAELHQILRDAVAGHPVEALDTIRSTRDGTPVHVALWATELPWSGPRRRILVMTADVTERVELREQLERQTDAMAEEARHKDEFLAMLSHELRNPLAPIVTALTTIDAGALPETERRHLEVIGRQTHNLRRMVDDLLDVSRISRGQLELRRQRIDLGAVVRSAVDATRGSAGERGHRLLVEVAPELWVDGDRVRLEQIATNLLANAVKYTGPGGRIRVEATSRGSEVLLRVDDDGAGIPAELLPHVFDLFWQGDRSLDRAQSGLGIGLTLVRRLVEIHGGRVVADSRGPGRGASFTVTLPAARPAVDDPFDADTAVRFSSQRSLRVLVVDDNRDAADMLSALFEIWGHRCMVAYDGATALANAAAAMPDVALLDIGLPQMDGYELARRLRRLCDGRRTALVAVTGYGTDGDRERARAAGFDHHLVKPVDAAELQSVVELVRPISSADPA